MRARKGGGRGGENEREGLCARGIERLREGAAIAGHLVRFARASESLGVACAFRRREGADVKQLAVLAAADPLEFVGTRRLEEEAGGAYTWRSILSGWFRSPLPSCTWRSILSGWFRSPLPFTPPAAPA